MERRKREADMQKKGFVLVAVIAVFFGFVGGFLGARVRLPGGAPPAYLCAGKADFKQLSGSTFSSNSAEIKHLKAEELELSGGGERAYLRLSGGPPGPRLAFMDSRNQPRIELFFDERSISTFTFNDVFGKPKFSVFFENYRTGPPFVTIYGHDEKVVWAKP
jgi:hypothetical protein